jgi:hypothetical protein
LSNLSPQYWMFWIGLTLVVLMWVGRDKWSHWANRGLRK